EQAERTQGPARSVVLREPDSGKYQLLLEVQGKGKEKVVDEQAAHDLLTLHTPTKKSPIDQFIFQRHPPMHTEPTRHVDSPSLDVELPLTDTKTESNKEVPVINAGDQDEGQARLNPGKQDEGQAGPNPGEQDEGQENLKLPTEDQKPHEEESRKTNAETEVQSMVSVPIHQDTSSVPPMTTPVIDLTTMQSDSPLPTSITTTSIITTTTSLPPPPQPRQSIADSILVSRIGKLEQHRADLIQNNLALEERLDKQGTRLYNLENLNIPHKVSQAVDEIVTDAVGWAMQVPLRAHFRDLPTVDIKEILQQWMFEDNSYNAHEEEARKKKRKKHAAPRTPSGSPPYSPPPLPPPSGASGAPGISETSGSSQLPPPPPPLSTGASGFAQQTG
ncbi:hypothetical protein Tco_1528141, partial [Tanacetum coccineum]